ncbi:uncharacterized protein LOC128872543 [Hylaeus volcanicus]|uniref:uncharacterized protein LOC128872543 n=1 Tax=Hylaeus volcanicus TaxID=313075 RepID=UPI0023B7C59F|nr:uncharacterized protein LOC128872543 [Hylaeus volcanicus]
MSSFEVNGGVVDVYEPSSEDLRKQRENNETGNNRRNSNDSGHRISREINSPNKCPCTPTPKPRRNIFVRGFSNLRKKMRRSNSSRCEYSVCNNPRECRKCPVKKCCAENTSKERNRSTPERRKVKFSK